MDTPTMIGFEVSVADVDTPTMIGFEVSVADIKRRKAIGKYLGCDLDFVGREGMTITQLIEALQEAKERIGDVEVFLSRDDDGSDHLPLYALEVMPGTGKGKPKFAVIWPRHPGRRNHGKAMPARVPKLEATVISNDGKQFTVRFENGDERSLQINPFSPVDCSVGAVLELQLVEWKDGSTRPELYRLAG